ncbi:unnamed protein product [Brassicogethes aeneus]|uniref:Glycosyl transferase family 1 domain-containing protein n=1 Tax=Brassicogethes aeneus TaxID=1431903 RepID=A0A9P0F944_BRAAE|nr:unnamed protein product [Brassicogethes aeneus]
MKLKENNCNFKLSLLGETFTKNSEIFEKAKLIFAEEIINFGFVSSKNEYFSILQSSHVVVSTAKHEFFGVSMMEATYYGCFPLAPNGLVYPEIYPKESLYSDIDDLYKKLQRFCVNPSMAIELRNNLNIDFSKYSLEQSLPEFYDILNE